MIIDTYFPQKQSITISTVDLSVGVVERVLVFWINPEIVVKTVKIDVSGERSIVDEGSTYKLFPVDESTLPPFQHILEAVFYKYDLDTAIEKGEELVENLTKLGFKYVSEEHKLPIEVYTAVALRMALSDNEED